MAFLSKLIRQRLNQVRDQNNKGAKPNPSINKGLGFAARTAHRALNKGSNNRSQGGFPARLASRALANRDGSSNQNRNSGGAARMASRGLPSRAARILAESRAQVRSR